MTSNPNILNAMSLACYALTKRGIDAIVAEGNVSSVQRDAL